MKKIFLIIPMLLFGLLTWACPACEKQQPKLLKGISHGAGPDGNVDLLIVGVSVVIVLFTLYFSVKWLIKPGEKSPDHIKRLILKDDGNDR